LYQDKTTKVFSFTYRQLETEADLEGENSELFYEVWTFTKKLFTTIKPEAERR
jgi:hypothetical protein